MRFSATILAICALATTYLVSALPSTKRDVDGHMYTRQDCDEHGKRDLFARECFGLLDPTSDTTEFKPEPESEVTV
ncbi:hypothetical protein BC629DRAFT_1594353 [Irpex lacteus]|nr:hypothetical protein BC629DRAFT_1594353 [Irpex lacteus]